MKISTTNPKTGIVGAAAEGIKNVTKSTAIDPAKNTAKLAELLKNKSAKLDWMDRKLLIGTIKDLNSGKTAVRTIKAVGAAVGRVVSKLEARKILEARLNARTAQKALQSNENIQKKAIEAGLWNNGINYVVDTPATGTTEVAEGATGNSQIGTIGGSFLGG